MHPAQTSSDSRPAPRRGAAMGSRSGDAGARGVATNAVLAQYESEEAAQYYSVILGGGGPDLHYGIYTSPDDSTTTASAKTVTVLRQLAEAAGAVFAPGVRVLDLGAGAGGAAQLLAETTGVSVTCVNLCRKQNEANREAVQRRGLSALITVVDGSYDDLPADWTATFDIVWSQDAILHAADKATVFAEAARALVHGGYAVVSDVGASANADAAALAAYVERMRLAEVLTAAEYEEGLAAVGIDILRTRDMTGHIIPNYRRMLGRIARERGRLDACSDAFLDTVVARLRTEITALQEGEAHAWFFLVGRKCGGV